MSQQAEQEVMAAMLLNSYLANQCDLEPEEFQVWTYQEVYAAIRESVAAGEAFDVITLGDELSRRNPGHNFSEIMSGLLERSVGSKSMFTEYCKIIRKDYRLKQAADIGQSLLHEIQENKNIEAADTAISQLMALGAVGRKYDWTLRESVKNGLELVEDAREKGGLVGVETGLEPLNQATGGWHDTDLIVVGARPAMGKTALMLNFANAAKCPVGIISAEQGNEQIGLRMVSIYGKIDAQKLRTAKLFDNEWDKLSASARALAERQIFINDMPGINIVNLTRQAREWKYKHNIGLLFVDYAQKIKGSHRAQSRLEQVTEVVGALKNLAKELDIPVLTLAQVNRGVDNREDKRPNMGDLSDASEIEKEADLIVMLYRDEVYHEDSPDKGIAELIIEKNRHGPTGMVRCNFQGQFMRFEELAPKRYSEQFGGAA